MKLKSKLIFVSSTLLLVGVGCVKKDNTVMKPSEPVKLNFSQTVFSLEDRETWYQALRWPEACESDFQQHSGASQGGLAIYPVSKNNYLVRITCNIFAYQETSVFMLAKTNPAQGSVSSTLMTLNTYNPQTKKLEPMMELERKVPIVVGLETFDETAKTLQIFAKYRGAGDCGAIYSYKIENQSVTLIRQQIRECTDEAQGPQPGKTFGDDYNPPEYWPEVYEKK